MFFMLPFTSVLNHFKFKGRIIFMSITVLLKYLYYTSEHNILFKFKRKMFSGSL